MPAERSHKCDTPLTVGRQQSSGIVCNGICDYHLLRFAASNRSQESWFVLDSTLLIVTNATGVRQPTLYSKSILDERVRISEVICEIEVGNYHPSVITTPLVLFSRKLSFRKFRVVFFLGRRKETEAAAVTSVATATSVIIQPVQPVITGSPLFFFCYL